MTEALEEVATRTLWAQTAPTTFQIEGVVPLEGEAAGEAAVVAEAPSVALVLLEDMTTARKEIREATATTSQARKIPFIRMAIMALACLSTVVLISRVAMVRSMGTLKVRLKYHIAIFELAGQQLHLRDIYLRVNTGPRLNHIFL